jgi:type 2 lantibiotic biosynthesis protein LanM
VTRAFDEEQRRQLAGRALTLFERLDDLDALDPGVEESTVDELLAEWEEVFHDRTAFEDRLARADITESECRAALRVGRLADDRPLPEWVDRLESIVAAVQSSEPSAAVEEVERRGTRDEGQEGTEEGSGDGREWVFGELSAAVAAHVRDSAPESVTDTLSPSALDAMVGWFRIRFERRFTRVLYVEFKTFVAAHDRDLAFADPADFEDPPTRYYDRFVDRLFDGGFATLCLEYPVFARLLAIQARQWEAHLVEFCRRVDRDRARLAERFDLDGPPGTVTDLEPLADDTHGDGRAVMRVEFDSGPPIAYKPRSVDAGETFYRILDRFSDHVGMEFRFPAYLARDGYGWMEWIEPEGCADRAAVERYYRRAGVLICLAYFLEFTDCHVENTIAAGEHPLLVDAETVLHPFFAPARTPSTRGSAGPIQTDSVLLSHLLPQAVLDRPREERQPLGTLLAGIPLAADVVEVPYKEYPVVKAPNTDVMAVAFERGRIDRRRSVPTVDGVAQTPDAYVNPLVDGFETAYETVLALRDDGRLTEHVGIPDAFERLETRAVYRPTMRYAELLQALRSWECLADGARFGIELEALVAPFTDDRTADPPWLLYEAERRALTRFDPPRLTARPGGTAIEIDGSKIGARADVSGVERCRDRIGAADRADMLTQVEILRGALGTVPAPELAAAEAGARQPVGDDEFRAEARDVFERVREAAFRTDEGYGWVEVVQRHGFGDRQPLAFRPDNGALYMGRTGIAVFVAALYRVTGDDRYREFAFRAVEPTLRTLREGELSPTVSTLGGASGFGSIAYGVGVVGDLLDRPGLLDRAGTVTDHLTAERIAADDSYDVVHGSTGTILGLLGLHDRRSDPDLVARAVECGDHLLENRVDAGAGRAWLTIEDSTPLTGFAHGAAGIAYALFRLWDETGDDRYRDAALEALAFEDGTYSEDERNWPTMRGNGADGSFPDQWCYGRAGIGLARLGTTAYHSGDAVTSGLERALTGVPTDGLSEYDHLCCGNAGRAEFLLEAQRRLGRREGEARALLGGTLARKRDVGAYRTQTYTDRLTKPSLFRGLAGIGYAMLRVTDPEALPCLLLWE